ncbi:hypothetical protein DCAR_0205722 [Daucus carota subsp. sativus]|uniref:Replication factor A C-terminal domain-containing protein n=1 Tax=Daucus carota subsp. sativus TaxID=79200 RepID=A0AAF0WBR6_DAUCS|nr:hypothetical protein DCAR_0205722 [Daucus carota subsp. sativus]
MSNNYEYLNNVHSGRTDWKVKVRIIREWRGVTITGQPYKGYNLLLLDAKNVRMEAFVPLFLMEKLQNVFILGKMYAISNFQVKNYTETDKWRCVTTDRQIQFTNQTRAKELHDNDYFIAKNCFEFCDLGDIKSFANQTKYLADVVGVVTRREDLKLVHTKQGVDKYQIRMTIADGRNYLNITLWNNLAECFQSDISSSKYEEPLIVIIAAGKVGIFEDEYDMCNFSPTAYYMNYNHHIVAQLRKMSTQPEFKIEHRSIVQTKKEPELKTIQQIKTLGEDYIEEEVICQVQITAVQESNPWYYSQCTTCYKQIDQVEGTYRCSKCNNRIVPYPDKKFAIIIVAKDETGEINILLMDRPIQKLSGKTVLEMEEEEKGKFPATFKTMEKGIYTIKLEIREFNIKEKEEIYIGNDIYQGSYMVPKMKEKKFTVQQATEISQAQSSGTSIHLDNISQL